MGRIIDIIIGTMFFIVLGLSAICLLPLMAVIGICLLIYIPIECTLIFINKLINKN